MYHGQDRAGSIPLGLLPEVAAFWSPTGGGPVFLDVESSSWWGWELQESLLLLGEQTVNPETFTNRAESF